MLRPGDIVKLVSIRYNNPMNEGAKIASLIERLGNLLRAGERSSGQGLLPVHVQMLSYLSVCNRYSDTPAAVTEFVGATKGTTSQSIGVLERKGYLRKRPDDGDGRVIHLSLTAKGKRFVVLSGAERVVYDADPKAVPDEAKHLQRKSSLEEDAA